VDNLDHLIAHKAVWDPQGPLVDRAEWDHLELLDHLIVDKAVWDHQDPPIVDKVEWDHLDHHHKVDKVDKVDRVEWDHLEHLDHLIADKVVWDHQDPPIVDRVERDPLDRPDHLITKWDRQGPLVDKVEPLDRLIVEWDQLGPLIVDKVDLHHLDLTMAAPKQITKMNHTVEGTEVVLHMAPVPKELVDQAVVVLDQIAVARQALVNPLVLQGLEDQEKPGKIPYVQYSQ